jgi:Mg2+/Co2+ transporter CorB
MTLEIGLTLGAIVLLIGLSAFFNMSETALTASSRARMHALEQEGNSKARLVNQLLSAPEKMIGAVLIGNTLVDVFAAALASTLAVSLVGDIGVAYATGIVTVLIVIFAAVLPKTFALAAPDTTALFVTPIMRGIVRALTPFTIAIEYIVRAILKLTPSTKDDEANILSAHEEIRGAIDLQAKEGAVQKVDAFMLGGVLDLRELQVADIMIHRTKMETLNHHPGDSEVSVHTRTPLEGPAGKHRCRASQQGSARRARPFGVGPLQTRCHEFCAAPLVRAGYDIASRSAQSIPEAQGADGARRR